MKAQSNQKATGLLFYDIIFTDNKQRCWKVKCEMGDMRIDEMLVNIERQFKLK